MTLIPDDEKKSTLLLFIEKDDIVSTVFLRGDAVNEKALKSSGFVTRLRRLCSCLGFTLLEILATRMNIFDQLLTKWRKPVFFKEIHLLDISSDELVLHLGCGALPSAAVFIAQEKNAPVVGIDNNRIAVRLAQSYIKKRHLSDYVTIEYGDGVTYSVRKFDVIFIAVNVWPIDRVLLHLFEEMKPTARILCKGSHQDITTLLKKKEFHTRFSVVSRLQHPKTESFLLTRKK
jgi:protein-L-isoaspartate O-methyltransferase